RSKPERNRAPATLASANRTGGTPRSTATLAITAARPQHVPAATTRSTAAAVAGRRVIRLTGSTGEGRAAPPGSASRGGRRGSLGADRPRAGTHQRRHGRPPPRRRSVGAVDPAPPGQTTPLQPPHLPCGPRTGP